MGIFNLRFVVFKKSLHFLYEAWVLNLTSVKGSQGVASMAAIYC